MSQSFDSAMFSRRSWVGGGALVVMVLLAAGCVSVETVAPPVAGLRGGAAGDMVEGRRLYLTTCTKCHTAEPVRDYTAAEWATILPEMAEDSHFTPAQTAAVAAYIHAVLTTPPAPSQTEG